MDHHPDMAIRFGLVTISLTTHSARGLTRLDFDQAERLNSLT
jgi:4a-hydroxytetrahydrobiopterin dehydratase